MITRIYQKLIGIWADDDDLGTKAARGSILLFLSRSLSKIILLARTVIVARFLFPHDIGLFGLATLLMTIVELPFQTGFNSAIIQDEGEVHHHLDSAWTVNIIRGVLLAGILFLIAPLGAIFFNNPLVIPVARALSLVLIITSFENIGVVLLDRHMRFNRQFFYSIGNTLIQVFSVVVSVIIFRNVWALVVGMVIAKIGSVLISYWAHPYRPRLNFDLSGAKHLYGYGKWIGISGVTAFLVAQGDSLMVGKLINTASLAFYQMAFSLGTLPVIETVSVLGSVLFPLFSNIKNDTLRLKSVFLRVSKFIYAFMVPAAIGLFVLSSETVRIIYGDNWLPAVPVLSLVIIYGFIRSFEYLALPLLQGIGKPKIVFINSLLQATVLFAVIVPLTHSFGITGTAMAAIAGLAVGQIYLLVIIRKEIKFGFQTFVRGMYLPIASAFFMATVIYWLKGIIPVDSGIILIGYVLTGAILYFLALILLDIVFKDGFQDSFKWVKKSI